ncbi:MAG: UDP-N-acetylglucosamine 1-carboxyvinyltransferase [Candidatus Limivicinus sp.]|jgi:UDP-N-acetylglucosamine 1-carboxyvinyltransferase
MDIWHIRGGNELNGSCFVQGSKNASLPIIAASIISPAHTELRNVPQLRDVDAALRILRHLGCSAEQRQNDVYIDSTTLSSGSIPHSLMEEMRSSVIFMGALLARCGYARLSLPGGCQLGKRPIDLHLSALRQMGAEIDEDGTEINCRAEALHGAEIFLPFPSVGATENIMLAACAAKGKTRIHGAAREPEITALQEFLISMGANIYGAGGSIITIDGFEKRENAFCRIIPDRIVASTLACAVAAVGGNVEMRGVIPEHFSTVLYFLNQSGCDIISRKHSVRVKSSRRLSAPGEISTRPYPGFPTDAQPVLMAALLKAEGRTLITENIFENRYRQVPELIRLGADIVVDGKKAVITGVDSLHGAVLNSTDLRGGAAMIIAGLSAEGETVVFDDGHVNRGYERFDMRLRAIGADIYLEN